MYTPNFKTLATTVPEKTVTRKSYGVTVLLNNGRPKSSKAPLFQSEAIITT